MIKKSILAFYLTWYLYVVFLHFDSHVMLWVNALIISGIVGIALNASVTTVTSLKSRVRLFIIPFAVSSYTSITRENDFFLIFPKDVTEVSIGVGLSLAVFTGYFLFIKTRAKQGV